MRKIIIIPARHASSRFPGKPLAIINGKTMIERVVEQCRKARGIDEIYVATDHVNILDKAWQAGANGIMTGVHNSGSDRAAEVARMLVLSGNDVVINVQGDVPFVSPKTIEELSDFIANDDDYHIATAAKKRDDKKGFFDRNNVKAVVDKNNKALSFTRDPFRVDRGTDGVWLNHIGIYAYRNAALQAFSSLYISAAENNEKLEQLRALDAGMRIKVIVSSGDCGIDVNTPKDLVMANKIARLE